MILILGNPGAGKTTQTQLLGDYLKCPWFSMGQLIRDNVTGSERKAMLAGKIIGDDVTLNIVDKALSGLDLVKKECVFEGNPRSIKQARWWLDQQTAGRLKITALIHMVADPKVAEDRMIKRGRLDDHHDNVIETRFNEYQRSVKSILDFLIKNGVKIHTIDANKSIEDVAADIHKDLKI
jgi:adenylate kinase